ncbi:MAG TPA: YIP1 family protein [Gammaproteobacteria bacterium]|jgi:hypothetical protein|nr:YIP1 family protein [Gammaproteobacteria bacterium]
MAASRSLTSCLLDTFVAPAGALDAARERSRWLWAPLLLVIAAAIAMWIWYYRTVDFAWLTDHLLSAGNLTPDQASQARAFMTPGRSLGIACVSVVVVTFVVYAVQALYLMMAARLIGEREIGFGQWFSLTAWTRLPNLLAIVAMALAYGFASGNQIAPAALSVLSLNGLLFHFQNGHAAFSLANSITLTLIWSLGLLTYGVMRWLNRPAVQALAIVVGPYIIIYGIWLAIAVS